MRTGSLILSLLLSFGVIASVSCRNNDNSEDREEIHLSDTLKSMAGLWNHYRSVGRQDSVIMTAAPLFEMYVLRNDTTGVKYTGMAMAQAYILSGAEYDSTKRFMTRLLPYFGGNPDSKTASVYWTVLGHYNLKYELDYSEALSCYLKALDLARKNGKVNSQITMLSNIVNIFYICSDKHGMDYALEAMRLAESGSANSFCRTAAYIAAAQVYCTASETDKALEILNKAAALAKAENIGYFIPQIHLLYGDIYTQTHDYARADMHYSKALEDSANTEPSTVSLIYLNYGRMFESAGHTDKAISQYSKGLKISQESHNMEFREKLLKQLAIVLFDSGRENLASHYFRQYMKFIDSISLENKERSLFDMLLAYNSIQHEYELTKQDLALSENRRRLLTAIFIIAMLAITSTALYILYARQRKAFKEAAVRYDEYRRRLTTETAAPEHDTMSDLFCRLESLMKEGAYRQKDLSLEKIASMLGSNRTYVSNTINKMAGVTFYSYLDSYRIKEATGILSNPTLPPSVSLKSIADDIGYNSPQVFHRAFKKETGTTPTIYRMEVLKISNKSTMNNT